MNLFYALTAGLLALTLIILLWPWVKEGKRLQAAVLALFIIAASVGGYALWGSPRVIVPSMEYRTRMNELQEQIKVTSALIKQNPKNLEAWLTLSQAFLDSGDYNAAANGFKEAVLISKGHPRIVMAYAEALILQADGVVTPRAKKSIDVALMLSPELPLARYYNAVWLLQEERNEEAMVEMKKLYNELPDDSSLKQRMKEQIGR